MKDFYHVFILSDSIGETASHVSKAVTRQFSDIDFIEKRFNYLRIEDDIEHILSSAESNKSIVLFTTVIPQLKNNIIEVCKQKNIQYHDIMSPIMDGFENFIGEKPSHSPGTQYQMDEDYFERIAAMEFAVKYDDGKDLRGLKHADVVLLGISRTSKTPLSMYLAGKNVKIANIPLVPEIPLGEEIYEVPRHKIVGLTNSPAKLNEIRKERLKALGLSSDVDYANVERILEELEYSDSIYKKLGCPVINVSNKAIEETANIILELIGYNKK